MTAVVRASEVRYLVKDSNRTRLRAVCGDGEWRCSRCRAFGEILAGCGDRFITAVIEGKTRYWVGLDGHEVEVDADEYARLDKEVFGDRDA